MSTYATVQGAIFQAQPIPFAAGQNLLKGEKNPYAIPCACDFAATNIPATGYIIDPSRFYNSGAIKTLQSIFFDNSQCNGTTQVSIPAFNMQMSLPPNSQGFFPILAPLLSGGVMQVTSTATSGVANVLLLNTYFDTQIWSTLSTSQGSAIPVSDAILEGTVSSGTTATASKQNVRTTMAQATATDRSGTVAAGGTSQALMAANAARQGWTLQNIDYTNTGEALWYNPTGGAAGVGTPGSFALAAGSSIAFPGGAAQGVTSNAINVVAATTGHKYSAIEW